MAYNDKVNYVNDNFRSQLDYGFDTDQGRIYLKYGTPHSIYEELKPESVFPFKIWHYQKGDMKFVFYAPNELQEHFILLHSNVRKEAHFPRWYIELQAIGLSLSNVDLDPLNNYNKNDEQTRTTTWLRELFNNPR